MVDELSFVKTKCAELRKDAAASFECVVFEDKRKGVVGRNSSSKKNAKKSVLNSSDIDIRRVKREVIKFGLSGFDAKTKQEAKIEQAIRLGAKPPKKKYVNYKELKAEKARQLQEAEEKKKLMDAGKIKGVSSDKGKKYLAIKKRKDNILQAYGKVSSSFKNKKGRRKK
ncbi:uncharacterized protein C1orf131 [Schistocerca piceifrons]|uniref:uncharacterized protein C1orf131 n=1 Tax=Schistocerca piceifrons TaxID=274613 RepID=UPI001F5EACB3|nr:uncharacterized protein C1orf131 [Schistocerca piceifrons]